MPYKCGSVVALGMVISFGLYGQGNSPTFVFAGDSLTAGYQNAQLIESGQMAGYANLIALQMAFSLNLPLIPSPGYPQISTTTGYAVVTGLNPVGRVNNQQTLDVAVPGYTVAQLVGFQPPCPPDYTNAIYVMAAEILDPTCSAKPGPTELQEAAGLKPVTSILWIGSNDVLLTLLEGTPPTDIVSFTQSYGQAVTTLAHASKHLVVANIPDVTLTPYLTSVPALAAMFNLSVSTVEAVFCLQPGDMVTPYALQIIEGGGTCLPHYILQGTAPVPVVIPAATISELRATVLAYNQAIAMAATVNGATLVDIYSLVNNLAANGIYVNRRKLTTAFGGGLFSLDGIHPTNVGYGVIANEFIDTMNQSLGTTIPNVNLGIISWSDPLFPAASTGHVSVGMADGLRTLIGQK